MAARNEALFKPFLFADQELTELVATMNPPAGTLADAVTYLREGQPGEAEVAITALLITRPKELGPWHRLLLAAAYDARGNGAAAVNALRQLLDNAPDSRMRLWAWQAMRRLGQQPVAGVAGRAEGAVIEVDAGKGVETLAVYADGKARYLLPTGAKVIWDRPDARLDKGIQAAISAATAVAADLPAGKLAGEPAADTVRLTVLTPGGPHAAESPLAAAATAPGAALYTTATALLEEILTVAKW